jgi:hypothetical protein
MSMIRGLWRSHKPWIVASAPSAGQLDLNPKVATPVSELAVPTCTKVVYVRLRAKNLMFP